MAAFDIIVLDQSLKKKGSTPSSQLSSSSTGGSNRVSANHPGMTRDMLVMLLRLGLKVGWVVPEGIDSQDENIFGEFSSERLVDGLSISHSHPLWILSLSRVRTIFFPEFTYGGFFNILAGLAKARGVGIAMACTGTNICLDTSRPARKSLQHVHLLFANPSEASRLTSVDDLNVSARMLAELGPEVVITNGDEGSYGFMEDKLVYEPSIQVSAARPEYIQGNYHAGYIKAWLDGRDPSTCLRWGNITGSLSLQAHSHPDFEINSAAIETFLKRCAKNG